MPTSPGPSSPRGHGPLPIPTATGDADYAASAASREAVEQRYIEVMRLLAAEPQLSVFKEEYEKLHRLLGKSHEGERRLISKMTELRHELSSHQAKTEAAVVLSQEDEASIATLRKEVEKAWAMADTAHAREVESRKAIQVLKKQVADLDALVEQSAGLSIGQEAYLRELLTAKKALEEEQGVLHARLDRLLVDRSDLQKRASTLREREAALGADVERRTAAYQSILSQLEEEQRERTAKEQSVKAYRANVAQVVAELERRTVRAAGLASDERGLATEFEEAVATVQTLTKQLEERQMRFQVESERLSSAEAHNSQLASTIPVRGAQLREKESEAQKLQKTVAADEAKAREQQQELQKLVRTRDELLLSANAASGELDTLLGVLQDEDRQLTAIEAELKKAMKEKTRTIAAISGKESARIDTDGRRIQEESKRRRLEQDLDAVLAENESLRRQAFELEQVQGKVLASAQSATLSYQQTRDRIRSRRADVSSMRDLLTVHEQKLKVQGELLDRVRMDRNHAEKQLRESELEWRQLTERHDARREDMEVIKTDLIDREAALCQLHTVNVQLQREIANAEQRASHLHEDLSHASTRIEALQHEAQQLQQIISSCDAEKSRQSMRLFAITNERNIIAAQLIRRSEELSLLYDKAQLQQSALGKGAADYNQRADEVIAARDRLQELRLRCRLILVRLRYMHILRKREMAGGKALVRERAKVRALKEELRKPLNVHRWRQLEGRAPALLDALAKVNMLQQAYMARCDELTAVTAQITRKEAEYEDLRKRLARLPGPEAAEDLALYKENIDKRGEQIAAMDGELTEVEQHAEVLADEVRELNRELAKVRRSFFEAKAKHDALMRERAALRQTWGASAAVTRLAMSSRAVHSRAHANQLGNSRPGVGGGAGSSPASGENDDGADNDTGGQPYSTNGNTNAPTGGSQRVLSKHGRRYHAGNAPSSSSSLAGTHAAMVAVPSAQTQREAVIAHEEELLKVLSTGTPAPNFPLQKPRGQKQFVGGGFALTR